MSGLTPELSRQLVAMRNVVMSSNISDDTREACLRRLDVLDDVTRSFNDHLTSRFSDLTAMIEAFSGPDAPSMSATDEGSDLANNTEIHNQGDAKHELSQAALDCEDSTTVGIKSDLEPDADKDEGDDSLFIGSQEEHVSKEQTKKEDSGPSNFIRTITPSETELKLLAVFSERDICEEFARGECCQLEHTLKPRLGGTLKLNGQPGALKQGESSKMMCEKHTRGQCCKKFHRSREEILHMLNRVEPSLVEYFSSWPVDDTLNDIDLYAPPHPYVAPASSSFIGGSSDSESWASSDQSGDESDGLVDNNESIIKEELEALHTEQALVTYRICKDYYDGECCGQIHVSAQEARSMMPKQGTNFLTQKKALMEEKNVCWKHVAHKMSVEHGSANVKPPCCKHRHPHPEVMFEEIQKHLNKVAQKQKDAETNARIEAARAARIKNTPKYKGLIRASPTHR
jgi:hypothetical protein